MFRTRNDRRLEARAALGDQLALTITSSEDFEIDWGDGTTDTVSSGFRQSHTYAREYHGPVIIRPVDKTSVNVTFTEWTLEGNFDWVDVGAFPVEATSIVVKDAYRLKHEAEWAPTNLSNVYLASGRGMLPGDVDRLIQALEERTQNNGTLLVQGTPRKSNPQLETLQGSVRNWSAEVVPAVCLQVTTALAPFTRIVDGIARWVRGQRNGTPRQLEPGRCASFNNLDDVVTCGNSVLGHVDQTITARVRIDGTGSGGYIFSTRDAATGGSLSMYLTSGFLFTATFGYGSTHTTVVTPTDKWVDLAITYSKSSQTATFYIDGEQVGTAYNDNAGSNAMSAGTPILLGCRVGGAGQHFYGGEIAEIRHYDYILSQENLFEIAAMDWTKTEDQIGPRDPLIWYKLDEESTVVRNSGSLGVAGDGVVSTSNIANFRNKSGVNDVFSYQNNVGFSSINVPRNESNPDFDVDGNPLTYVGQAPIEPVIETACLTTNGSGDYVDTGVTLDGATEFTVFRRAKYVAGASLDRDGFMNSAGAESAVRIGRTADNSIYFSAGSRTPAVTLAESIPNGVVHTLALTSKVGGSRHMYLDGDPIATDTAASDSFVGPIENSLPYYIGATNETAPQHPSNAEYYEYYIYDRQLSDDEVLYLHTFGQQGVDPSNDGLVVCYCFGDGKSPIRDRSGNKNDGYLTSTNHAAAWAGRQSLYNPYAEGFVDLFGTTWPKLIGSNLDALLGIDCTGAAGQFARYQAWDFDCNEPNSPFALNCSEGRTFVKYEFTGDSGDRRMFASGALASPFTPEVPTVVEIYEDTLSVELASEVAKVY